MFTGSAHPGIKLQGGILWVDVSRGIGGIARRFGLEVFLWYWSPMGRGGGEGLGCGVFLEVSL